MHLGIIGFGNIATALLTLQSQHGPALEALTVLTRPEAVESVRRRLSETFSEVAKSIDVVSSASELLEKKPDVVAECAGHSAVATHVGPVLEAGVEVIVVSIGALADETLAATLKDAAQEGGSRVILPAGAIGGIDLLSALSPAEGVQVIYRGVKPPMAWAGTPAEQVLDLQAVSEATVFFRGSAREAALAYPKNANVAATLALAGAGFEATQVELVADPTAAGNTHAYEVQSSIANYQMTIENLPSAGNVKTSLSTIYSILREIRNRAGWVAI